MVKEKRASTAEPVLKTTMEYKFPFYSDHNFNLQIKGKYVLCSLISLDPTMISEIRV